MTWVGICQLYYTTLIVPNNYNMLLYKLYSSIQNKKLNNNILLLNIGLSTFHYFYIIYFPNSNFNPYFIFIFFVL